jgi:predicted Rossmann fold nucleotide-binding protein DprA/Smf involved in DNA uptake
MKEIQSVLKIVSDGMKMIAQGMEAISEKVDEIAKSQSAEEPKGKTSRRSAASKKKAIVKTAAKAPKKKAAAAPTAAETVHKIISRSQKGVDMATLMKKTGYDRKKVANIIYKLGKQGKIKSIDKGVYLKA